MDLEAPEGMLPYKVKLGTGTSKHDQAMPAGKAQRTSQCP